MVLALALAAAGCWLVAGTLVAILTGRSVQIANEQRQAAFRRGLRTSRVHIAAARSAAEAADDDERDACPPAIGA